MKTQSIDNDLSIIIVAYNVKDLVKKCLKCVEDSSDKLNKEVIYVDNGSNDGTGEMIKKDFTDIHLIESPENLGFSKANNLGYRSATGKYILLLNSDAFVGKNTLQILTDFMEKTPDCGALGCKAIDGEGNLLPSARYFQTPWRLFLTKLGLAGKLPFSKDINDTKQSHDIVRECDWVTGCCLLVRKDIVDTYDYFLRPELFMYNDDNDLCLRVKKRGWKVYFHPETITHLAGVNNKKIAMEEKDRKCLERLNIESEYVYFRHNYNIFWVLYHFMLMITFDSYQIIKNCLLMRGKENIRSSVDSIRLAIKLLMETNFGKSPVKSESNNTHSQH